MSLETKVDDLQRALVVILENQESQARATTMRVEAETIMAQRLKDLEQQQKELEEDVEALNKAQPENEQIKAHVQGLIEEKQKQRDAETAAAAEFERTRPEREKALAEQKRQEEERKAQEEKDRKAWADTLERVRSAVQTAEQASKKLAAAVKGEADIKKDPPAEPIPVAKPVPPVAAPPASDNATDKAAT